MQTRPDITLSGRAPRAGTTQIECPNGCGHVVVRLADREGVAGPGRPRSRSAEGTCPGCGEPYRIPIAEGG